MFEHMKGLVEDMWEELEGACHYAEKAMEARDNDPGKASTYTEMSRQELAHFDNLHRMAAEKVSMHKGDTHIEAVWDWEHGKMMRKAAKIRAMLEVAKG